MRFAVSEEEEEEIYVRSVELATDERARCWEGRQRGQGCAHGER